MSGVPTGLEPSTPVRLREVSVTERAKFRACRRQWLLTVVHRLEPPGANSNFWVGELVHAGLQGYYQHPLGEGERRERSQAAREAGRAAYATAAMAATEKVRADLGFLWEYGREEWAAAAELGGLMLEGYFAYDRETGGLGETVVVELRWRVPIPGTRGVLTLRVDLAVVDARGRLVVVDHKTAGSRPSDGQLDLDDQFTAYFWGYHAATGSWPDRVLRNVLLKRAPTPPRQIKGTKAEPVRLSKDKDQATTRELYLEEIRRLGLPRAEYEDFLAYLSQRGWEPFFARQETIRTRGQMAEFERNLATEWRDMRRVALHPEEAYPSPSPFNCPSCPVRTVCAAMMDGTDPSDVIRQQYSVADPRE